MLVALLLFGACDSEGSTEVSNTSPVKPEPSPTIVAPGEGGSCSGIDAFEEAIRNVGGRVWNYQASKSARDLAQMSDR